jgi:hypothetical protein
MIGCTPFLTAAFAAPLANKKLPSQQFLSGFFLWFAYSPLYARAKKAGTKTRGAIIGLLAAVLLMWGGGVGMLLQRKLVERSPVMPPLGWALSTSLVFGSGNMMKLLEMKRKGGVSPEVFLGQICKVCASFILLGSNSYLLGFHRTVPSAIRALIHGEREGQAEAEGEGEGEGEGDRGDAKEGKSKVP